MGGVDVAKKPNDGGVPSLDLDSQKDDDEDSDDPSPPGTAVKTDTIVKSFRESQMPSASPFPEDAQGSISPASRSPTSPNEEPRPRTVASATFATRAEQGNTSSQPLSSHDEIPTQTSAGSRGNETRDPLTAREQSTRNGAQHDYTDVEDRFPYPPSDHVPSGSPALDRPRETPSGPRQMGHIVQAAFGQITQSVTPPAFQSSFRCIDQASVVPRTHSVSARGSMNSALQVSWSPAEHPGFRDAPATQPQPGFGINSGGYPGQPIIQPAHPPITGMSPFSVGYGGLQHVPDFSHVSSSRYPQGLFRGYRNGRTHSPVAHEGNMEQDCGLVPDTDPDEGHLVPAMNSARSFPDWDLYDREYNEAHANQDNGAPSQVVCPHCDHTIGVLGPPWLHAVIEDSGATHEGETSNGREIADANAQDQDLGTAESNDAQVNPQLQSDYLAAAVPHLRGSGLPTSSIAIQMTEADRAAIQREPPNELTDFLHGYLQGRLEQTALATMPEEDANAFVKTLPDELQQDHRRLVRHSRSLPALQELNEILRSVGRLADGDEVLDGLPGFLNKEE